MIKKIGKLDETTMEKVAQVYRKQKVIGNINFMIFLTGQIVWTLVTVKTNIES